METRQKRKRSDSVIRHVKRFKNRFGKLDKKLEKLNAMVGMVKVKESIMGQLKLLLCTDGAPEGHFLNTCITGPPGCGKTTLAQIIFDLWSSLSVFSEGSRFTILHRSDLVAPYLGQTAGKTRKVLQKHKNGCIFIDEFYSIVNGDSDSYGVEALDVLNTFMSENPGTIVIVAGYKKEINKIFEKQPGLHRRFAWKFDIPAYTPKQVFDIFKIQLAEHGWTVEPSAVTLFNNRFKYAGGDTMNVALKAKINYAERNWMAGGDKKLLYEDVQKAIEKHFKKKEVLNMYL